jgi:hypothetical protein
LEPEIFVRSFLYLDSERLRSYSAQVLGGVPESHTIETEHDMGAGGKAEAGLLHFIKASGEADYRYRRSSNETSSLHHQIYTRFEEILAQRGALEVIDGNFSYADEWTMDHFSDGSFVKLRGRVQLVDYAKTIASMESLPQLYKAFGSVEMMNIKSNADANLISPEEATARRKDLASRENEVKKMPIADIAKLARSLYAEGEIRIKVHPAGAPDEYVVVGTGSSESLLVPLGSGGLVQSPDLTSWVAVGQISAAAESNALKPILTGNGLEDSFEAVSASFRVLVKTGNAAVYPVFEFMPLAIYREIEAP